MPTASGLGISLHMSKYTCLTVNSTCHETCSIHAIPPESHASSYSQVSLQCDVQMHMVLLAVVLMTVLTLPTSQHAQFVELPSLAVPLYGFSAGGAEADWCAVDCCLGHQLPHAGSVGWLPGASLKLP